MNDIHDDLSPVCDRDIHPPDKSGYAGCGEPIPGFIIEIALLMKFYIGAN